MVKLRENRGYLISFEGLDGAGKTTQTKRLASWLETAHIDYLWTREPGGTPLGVEIRQLLFKRPELSITPLAEAFLFQADRAQHFTTVVLPALADGKVVVTDRCFDSSIAYQGATCGVGVELVEQLSLLATQGRVPDLTIFLDLAATLVHSRTDLACDQSGLRVQRSRFDAAAEPFHQSLRGAYLSLARAHPARIKLIDASQSPEQIHQEVLVLVQKLLKSK
jgi:dTMP kinase